MHVFRLVLPLKVRVFMAVVVLALLVVFSPPQSTVIHYYIQVCPPTQHIPRGCLSTVHEVYWVGVGRSTRVSERDWSARKERWAQHNNEAERERERGGSASVQSQVDSRETLAIYQPMQENDAVCTLNACKQQREHNCVITSWSRSS